MCVHMLGVLLGRGPGQLGLATTFTSFLSLLLAATMAVALVGTGTIARAPRAACIAARPITLHALARAEPYSWLTLTSRLYIYICMYISGSQLSRRRICHSLLHSGKFSRP